MNSILEQLQRLIRFFRSIKFFQILIGIFILYILLNLPLKCDKPSDETREEHEISILGSRDEIPDNTQMECVKTEQITLSCSWIDEDDVSQITDKIVMRHTLSGPDGTIIIRDYCESEEMHVSAVCRDPYYQEPQPIYLCYLGIKFPNELTQLKCEITNITTTTY